MKVVRVTCAASLFLLLGATGPAYAQQYRQDENQGKRERQQGGRRQGPASNGKQRRAEDQSQQQGPRQERRPEEQSQQRSQRPERRAPSQQPQMQRPREQQSGQQQQPTRPLQLRTEQQQQFHAQRQESHQPQRQQMNRTRQQAAAWQQQRGWLQQGAWQGNGSWRLNRAQQWERDHRSWSQRGGYGGYYISQERFAVSFGVGHRFRMRHAPTIYLGYPRFEFGGYSFLLVDPWPEYWAEDWYATDDLYIDYDDGYYLFNHRYPYIRLAITVAL